MEKDKDILVGFCVCGKFVKVSTSDEFASGTWVSSQSLSAVLVVQLLVAREVRGRVPMAHCDECAKAIISGNTRQFVVRTSRGVEVIYVPVRKAPVTKES